VRTRNKFKTTYVTNWWRGITVNGRPLQAEETAQHYLLYELKDVLVEGCFDWNSPHGNHIGRAPEEFMTKEIYFLLQQCGNEWLKSEKVCDLVEEYFVHCIARGKVGTAFYFLVRFGGLHLHLYYFDAHRTDHEKGPNVAMEKLMRAAVGKAEELRNFGVATALAEHLGQAEEADRLREMARELKQRATLDFMFYLEVKHNGYAV
jgi:hypothetical protein